MKQCASCKLLKTDSEFRKDRRLNGGLTARCNDCVKSHRIIRRQPHQICSVDGCIAPQHAQGLCTLHYQRLKRNGDTGLAESRSGGTWQVTEIELAYIAGFIDGEGTIGIKKTHRAENRSGYCYEPYLSIGNTDERVIQWLHQLFGGNFRKKISKPRGNAKPYLFVWITRSRTAVSICKMVRPYLRMKCRQADLLIIEFSEHKFVGGRREYEVAYWERLEMLYQQMRSMNQRGINRNES